MGNIKLDLANVITIGLVGFLGVFIVNRALTAAGYSQYKA